MKPPFVRKPGGRSDLGSTVAGKDFPRASSLATLSKTCHDLLREMQLRIQVQKPEKEMLPELMNILGRSSLSMVGPLVGSGKSH